MGIITYDQETNYLHNEDGEPVGKIFREGDGLGPLIEERVNRWLELSSERDKLREQVKILREALERVNRECDSTPHEDPHLCHAYDSVTAETVIAVRAVLEATKEGA